MNMSMSHYFNLEFIYKKGRETVFKSTITSCSRLSGPDSVTLDQAQNFFTTWHRGEERSSVWKINYLITEERVPQILASRSLTPKSIFSKPDEWRVFWCNRATEILGYFYFFSLKKWFLNNLFQDQTLYQDSMDTESGGYSHFLSFWNALTKEKQIYHFLNTSTLIQSNLHEMSDNTIRGMSRRALIREMRRQAIYDSYIIFDESSYSVGWIQKSVWRKFKQLEKKYFTIKRSVVCPECRCIFASMMMLLHKKEWYTCVHYCDTCKKQLPRTKFSAETLKSPGAKFDEYGRILWILPHHCEECRKVMQKVKDAPRSDVELVISQTGVNHADAVKALEANNGKIVDAIMYLCL